MIVKLIMEDGETLPSGFAKFILGSGPSYERKYKEAVPRMTLHLVRDGKTYRIEGGFWFEVKE